MGSNKISHPLKRNVAVGAVALDERRSKGLVGIAGVDADAARRRRALMRAGGQRRNRGGQKEDSLHMIFRLFFKKVLRRKDEEHVVR